jgi:hypothetical protein
MFVQLQYFILPSDMFSGGLGSLYVIPGCADNRFRDLRYRGKLGITLAEP